MILAIDIGNTTTKAAIVDADGVHRRVHITGSDQTRIRDALLRVLRRGTPAAVIIASVVPARTPHFVTVARTITRCAPLVVSAKLRLPIAVKVRRVSRLGMDRLCAACGAVHGRRRNAIVVDAGSAITIDLVRDRCFLGGAILPGPGVALSALHAHTGRLPLLSGRGGLIPQDIADTSGAMRVGVGLGTAGAIREIVRWLERRSNVRPTVFVTGGWAHDLAPLLPSQWCVDPDLVFNGLFRIAVENAVVG